jgi:hypothetical protein
VPVYGHAHEAAEKFGLDNTRLLARDWIHLNCPPGSSLLMEGGREHRSQYMIPVFDRLSNIDRLIAELKTRDPGKATYWTLKREYLSTLNVPRFDIHFVMWHEPWPTLQEAVALGIQYVVIDVRRFSREIPADGSAVLRSRNLFYQQLASDERVQKLTALSGSDQYWGPDLEIYAISP